jgi:hypothetical protein
VVAQVRTDERRRFIATNPPASPRPIMPITSDDGSGTALVVNTKPLTFNAPGFPVSIAWNSRVFTPATKPPVMVKL